MYVCFKGRAKQFAVGFKILVKMEIEESKVIHVFDLSNGKNELPLPEMEKTVSEKSLEKIRKGFKSGTCQV